MEQLDFDVVVVGGGLAGTRTALLLADRGISVCLLEARERLGGRTETTAYRGELFDTGAQWVAPPHLQPRLNQLLEELNLKTKLQFIDGKGILHFGGKLTEYVGEVSEVEGFGQYNEMIQELDHIAQQIPLECPWAVPDTEPFSFATPDAWLDARCPSPKDKNTRAMFESSIRCLFTSEPEELSWLFFLFCMKAGVNYSTHSDTHHAAQHQTIIGGAQQISERMGDSLKQKKNARVELEAKVLQINQENPRCVTVSFQKKKQIKTLSSRFVVLAVPPPFASRINYLPPLPPLRDYLTQRMRMGAVIKCFIFYKSPFWREKELSGEIFTDGEPICNYYDASQGNLFALIGFIAGKHALKMSPKTPEERKMEISKQLVTLFGEVASEPIGYLEKDWLSDPFSRGGYMATMTPNDIQIAERYLRDPLGRIVLAGTETATEWYGYMEGALQSAERSAKWIIQNLQSRL